MSEAALLMCWLLQLCAVCGARALLLRFLRWDAAGTEHQEEVSTSKGWTLQPMQQGWSSQGRGVLKAGHVGELSRTGRTIQVG